MNVILNILRMVRIYNAKIVLPVIWVFIFIGNAYSSELKQPREGDIYQTSRGEFVIKILSSRQLEFVREGAVMVAEYTVDGDSMRLTFDNKENKKIEYYKIISVGLKGDKDTLSDMVLYDKKVIDSFFNTIKERNINEVNSFLSKGIDPNYVNEYGESALLFAIMAGDAEVVRKLLSSGADPDSKDTHGTPVLTLASDEGYLDIVKVLLDAGADVNKKDNDGSTALMEASEKDHIDIVKILLVAGADPDVENDNGVTALWMASSNGLVKVSELLLPLTKNIDVREKYNKSTPLINMARWGKVSTVKALLDKGADMNAQDGQGWTALMWAAKDNYQDIVKLLLDEGADFKIKNRFGNTALKLAKKEGYREIVQMLEKAAAKE